MGTTSGIYKLVFVLHLVTVIVGFGSVTIFGVFGAKAKARGGREGLAVSQVTFDVGQNWSMWFIYAVPVLGIVLVLLSDDQYKFSQAWISVSFLLYFVALGISHGLHTPNLRRMNELATELVGAGPPPGGSAGGPPPQVAELEARGKRAAMLGGILNLTWVVIVGLMVWKPGAPGGV